MLCHGDDLASACSTASLPTTESLVSSRQPADQFQYLHKKIVDARRYSRSGTPRQLQWPSGVRRFANTYVPLLVVYYIVPSLLAAPALFSDRSAFPVDQLNLNLIRQIVVDYRISGIVQT